MIGDRNTDHALAVGRAVTGRYLAIPWLGPGLPNSGRRPAFFQYSETSMLATGGTTIPDGRIQADPRTTLILSRVGEQLALSDEDATFTIQFDPLATLPPLTQSTRDPVRNFDLLVELFEKNHALFEAQYFILYTSALSR